MSPGWPKFRQRGGEKVSSALDPGRRIDPPTENIMRLSFPFRVSLLLLAITWPMALPVLAETPEAEAILPPALPWDGASRSLALPPDSDDPWITPAEREGLERTSNYEETFAWLRRLVEAAPQLEMLSLGRSGQGRELWMVVASGDGVFTPAGLARTGKPTILAQAGIHSGEIDGKDAGLMLLRDLTVKGKLTSLLDRVNFLFIPILNVDGHERISSHGRVNQRGPERMGWRTNARNLNLNRDFAKADTPEVQALLRAFDTWQPDLFIDLHVTDGIDYQYDITWGTNGPQTPSPSISRWLTGVLDPPVQAALEAQGHIPGPLIFALDGSQPDASLFDWKASGPRFSDGYGAARHLPAILVENHSLKPYPQRVLGTYVYLAAVLETVGREGEGLRRAIAEDRSRRPEEMVLAWTVSPDVQPEQVEFLGVDWRHEDSAIGGDKTVVWSGQPVTKTLPRIAPTAPASSVTRPKAYWVPGAWTEVIGRLRLHGIEMETLHEPRSVEVEMYRLQGAKLAGRPFEGRVMVELPEPPKIERHRETYHPGSVRIPTDQPLGDLAILLLEPQAPDSFLRWGFFLEILSRTEYIEAYVIDPMATAMLESDPQLRAAFEKRLAEDEAFAADPSARRRWFYEKTPYFDERWLLYPVGREPARP